MIKTSAFQIQIVCPGCNSYHAVSGIVDFDTCRNCGKSINVSSVLNDKMFSFMDRIRYMNGFLSGSIEQMGGAGAYKLIYSSMPAYCEECFTVLDTELLINSIENKKPVTCPKCSHKMPVREADAGVREFHAKAIGVINDSFGVDFGEKNIEKDSMLVFKCMTCGAGLELTRDTKRTITCRYCDNENYLPDAIWTRLHPNKEVQPLFVLLELDENDFKESIEYFLNVTALNIYNRHFENFIREYFERPFTSDALLTWVKYFVSSGDNKKVSFNMNMSKLQKYFYDNLKLGFNNHSESLKIAAAENGAELPPELQKMLSEDISENVRLALAKNRNLAKDIIKKLQSDSNSSVVFEVKKHKTGFFSKLFD